MSMIKKLDGWYSAVTGMGTSRDKVTSVDFIADIVNYDQAAELWRGSDMAARVIEVWPEEMLRKGFCVVTPDNKDGEEKLKTVFAALELDTALLTAMNYMRAYGGGAILVGAFDGEPDLTMPLVPSRIKESGVEWLTVLTPREIQPSRYYTDPRSKNHNKPSHYRLTPRTPQGGTTTIAQVQTEIHESRIIPFDGPRADKFYYTEYGWGDSALTRVWEVLRGYNTAWGSIFNVVSDFSLGIYKVAGLAGMLSRDSSSALTKRLQSIDFIKSVMRAIVVDKESEDYTRIGTPVTGLSDLMDRSNERLAAAVGVPLTVLMGKSPGGLGSNGDSEIRTFYDRVAKEQKRILTPAIKKLVDILAPSLGIAPNYEIKYESLWQQNDEEMARARNTQANTDVAYINAGVLYPDEVAKARFQGSGYSFETPVDFAEREALDTITQVEAQVMEEPPADAPKNK